MHRKETKNLAITAIFVAIFLLQTLIPNIGYIRILPTLPAVTTIPLTVAIYSLLMGPIAGTFFGIFWGIARMVQAYTQPGDIVSLMLFQNFVIAVIPSVLAGLFPGLIGKLTAKKKNSIKEVSYTVAGAVTSLTNTVFVILLTSLVFMGNSAKLLGHLGSFTQGTPLITALIIALGLNGLVEAVFTAIVTPIIVTPLNKVLRRVG